VRPPDELDGYLRGDSALSRQYRRESSPEPPHELDRRVLRLVRGPAPNLPPLAFAASVLLSVALVLAIVFGPQSSKRADEAPHLVRASARADVSPLLYSSDPVRLTPRQWLADIAALRRAGRNGEADAEMRRFRAAYPDYPVGEPK
jgi:hypothetical protein